MHPRRLSACTRSSGPRTFAYLSGAALCLALLGLFSNLLHLQTLMNQHEHWIPSDWETHHFELLQATSRDSRKMSSVDDSETTSKEENVLRILSKRAVASLELCRGTSSAEQMTRRKLSSTTSSSSRGLLPRFGFLNELTGHLSLNMRSSTNATQTLTINVSGKQQSCRFPPSRSCQTSQMTMLVFAENQQEGSWRPLFLNLLHWVTDSLLSEIYVLLPASVDQSMLQDDIKYGHRLLLWHHDPTHKVTLVFGSVSQQNGVWGQISQLVIHNATSDAVIVMNGNVPYNGNAEGLASGFELWKRHSSSLVVSDVWDAAYQENTLSYPMGPTKEEEAANFRPMCHEASLTLSHNMTAVDHSLFLLPAWSGMMVHRSYLSCWLSHPVVAALRSYDSFEPSLASMVLWLAQLSGVVSAARLYPANVLRDGKGAVARRTGQGDLSRTAVSGLIPQVNVTSDAALLAHSSLSKGEKRDSATSKKTSNARQLAKALLAAGDARHRRLLVDETQDTSLDEIITDVGGFFGSLPSAVNDWCSEGVGDQEIVSCSIPWTSSVC